MVFKMSPIKTASPVLFVMLLLNTKVYASLRFTTPSDVFQIDQNFVLGDVVTDQIACDSSENNPIIRYNFVDSNEEKFAISTRENRGILSMSMDALQLPCFPGTEECEFSLSVSCSSFSSPGALATNTYAEINATRISVVYRLVNRNQPFFIDSSKSGYTFEVQEDRNVTANPVITTFNATDQDLGPCGQLMYSMQIRQTEYLRLDPSSGELSLLRPLDHETITEFLFTIIVENPTICASTHPLGNRVRVAVTVLDVNDEPPIFSPRVYSTSVKESSQPISLVHLNCSDKDTPPELLRFESLTPVRSIEVNFVTGQVSAPEGLDYEENSHFELQFKCLDLGFSESFDVANVTIDVVPINEHTPELLSGSISNIAVNDSLPVGTLIASNVPESDALVYINAIDRDEGMNHGEIQFRAQWHKTDNLLDYFSLDSGTGNVTLVKSLKYMYCDMQNADSIETITLSMSVCEATTVDRQTCPNFDIRLIIKVSGDCSPSFDKDLYNIQVNESTTVGTDLYSIKCNTPGILGDEPNTKLEIIPDSVRLFEILGGSLMLQESLDFEQENQYAFVVQCTDKTTQLQVQTSVIIEVLPANDNRPAFSHSFFTFSIDSASPNVELPLTIGQIQAFDMDTGLGGKVVYKINTSLDSQYLNVDSNGMVSLIQSPATQSCSKLVAVAEVSDGLYMDKAMILIQTTSSAAVGIETKIDRCDGYCVAFAASLILLLMSICLHIMTCLLLFCCYRKKQKDRLALFKESVLETSKTNSMARNSPNGHYSEAKNSVTVPCPMYSRSMTMPADSSIYHYATTERRCALDLKLPPIPSSLPPTAQAYERPLRKSSGRSELADYLEMQSVGQRGRCNSDPLLSQRIAEEDLKSDMMLLEDSEGVAERKVTLLGGGELTPERRSVDNIYDFIADKRT